MKHRQVYAPITIPTNNTASATAQVLEASRPAAALTGTELEEEGLVPELESVPLEKRVAVVLAAALAELLVIKTVFKDWVLVPATAAAIAAMLELEIAP